jgi:hypothetical protein
VLKLRGCKDEVDFSNDEVCLCYSDIRMDNFLITKAGEIYVIDFEHAAFLPTRFMSFALHGRTKALAQMTSDKISLPKSANRGAMGVAHYFLGVCSNPQISESPLAAVHNYEILTDAFFIGL